MLSEPTILPSCPGWFPSRSERSALEDRVVGASSPLGRYRRLHVILDPLRRAVLSCVVAFSFGLLGEGIGACQIVRDGSLGQTPGALSGPQYTIDVQNAAQQIRGNNLFHSFSDFNVNTGQTATFTGPITIANIINRVTGHNFSTIDGALNSRAAMPNANLFLMNPNGIMLGPNASFNIGGSIHLTTADVVRMGDGAQFFANLAKQSTLSSAPVVAFGFLGDRPPGPITVQAGPSITVDEGKAVSLIGGDVSVSGRTIAAPGGQITVAAASGPGEQSIAGMSPTLAGSSPGLVPTSGQGTIHLDSGTMLQTSSSTGHAGPIFIRGGKLIMEHASLEATTGGNSPSSPNAIGSSPGNIMIQVETVSLSNGTNITTSTSGAGKAGDIAFEAATLRSNVGIDGMPLTGAAPVTITSNSTGQGGAGTITITGPEGRPADVVSLSNTEIVANVTDDTVPTIAPSLIGEQVETSAPKYARTVPPPTINIAAQELTLANGTTIQADTTGGADAGAITLSADTFKTRPGPDGRVFISSTSNCGEGCLGGQAGDITIRGLQDADHAVTRKYAFVLTPEVKGTEIYVYHLARNMDLQGTDIYSKALGNAPGGKVLLRAQGVVLLTDSNLSVETQDFNLDGLKPNGEPARYQGLSQIDIIASDLVMKDSSIKADALVSDMGSCPLCKGTGPTAGEIWLRVGNSFTAENTSITNTSRGRAQAGITKIIKDHYFSEGALWDTRYPDTPTQTVKLTNSEVTVEAKHEGLPGYLRIRADQIILDHSIVNSQVNNVTNVPNKQGQLLDVEGAGQEGLVINDGRTVQGILLMSAKKLDITGGGIVAPTQGNRIGNRIELYADELTARPGTRPGGTIAEPRILNPTDPTRVVISSSSTGRGGAGLISIAGQRPPSPGEVIGPPSASIRLAGTDVLTDTRSVGRSGKIELRASGPIELTDASVFARSGTSDGGTVEVVSSGPIVMNDSRLGTSSTGGLGGSITVRGSNIDLANRSHITAESHGAKDAGKIQLISENNISVTNSTISTEALKASGGDIKLTAPNSVTLKDSTLTASVAGGNETTGGKIDIDPQYVVIQNSQILAKAADGNGGRIAIEASKAVLIDPGSRLDATSSKGVNGQILIQSPIQQLAGAIAPLPQAFAVATNLYGQRCAAQKGGQFSSFVPGARDGIPPQPGDLIASPLFVESIGVTADTGRQAPMTLAAARLGLPDFEPVSPIFLSASGGCRS
ncbi:filamentous hemagglutinin N-terminal domain-containing protein [Nitrospira sp. Nam80]